MQELKIFLTIFQKTALNIFLVRNNMYPADSFCLPRQSKVIHTYNAVGSSLVELCCTFDIHIMNGRLFDDTEGNFKCFVFQIIVGRL